MISRGSRNATRRLFFTIFKKKVTSTNPMAETAYDEIKTVSDTDTIKHVSDMMVEYKIGAVLVTQPVKGHRSLVLPGNQKVVGILSERDVVRAVHWDLDLKSDTVVKIMTPVEKMKSVEKGDDIYSCLSYMLGNNIRHLAVRSSKTDEIMGIFSMR